MNKFYTISLLTGLISLPVFANNTLQDMSDPLAVYTSAAAGTTNKGLNLKIARIYDTGSETLLAANVLEVKGFAGEWLGWDGNSQRDNSIDNIRIRNFQVDITDGRGSQIDLIWDFDGNAGSFSYSLIQALPAMGPVQLYPLGGLGLVIAEDSIDGYKVPGSFAVIGVYSKFAITDQIWLNYNPMYNAELGGSDQFMDNFGGLTHEFAASYQLNPRQNIRLFANWSEDISFEDGDFRLEFNHQF